MNNNMIKILINNRDYSDYDFIDPDTNNTLSNESYNFINPIELKLFTKDYLDINDNSVKVHHSYIRKEAKMAGVLILQNNKTYGRSINGKRLLYKCIPDDKRLPVFLVPYDIKNSFNKKQKNKYVVFEFNNWENKHPHGTLTLTIGDINILENFFEYQLYCKSLNISISEFNKSVKNVLKLKTDEQLEDLIFNNDNYNIKDRTSENIFSIDPKGSYDFDDALSIESCSDNTYKVTVFISNVYVWLDTLNIWNSFSKRVSTIYLPDYRRPMLPTLLSEHLCSLQEHKNRFALATDFIVDTNGNIKVAGYNNCMIRVKKNYEYEDSKLLKTKEYNLLLTLANRKDSDVLTSHDVISYWMKQTNISMGLDMYNKKVGIFRSVKYIEKIKTETKKEFTGDTLRVINNWNNITGQYINYDENDDLEHEVMNLKAYVQITSPIRRLVDLLNQIIFIKNFDIVNTCSYNSNDFVKRWLIELDYINNSMRSIRKIQTECNLLNLCMTKPDILKEQHEGVVFDKIKKNDGTYNYMVYIKSIKMLCRYICPFEIKNYSNNKFLLFIFHNEDKYKKKIRLQIIN